MGSRFIFYQAKQKTNLKNRLTPMTIGENKMPSHAPTPEEVEQAVFFVKWWQEFLGGLILGITGLYFRSKGKSSESVIIPMSEEEIEHRMTICKQSILLSINEIMKKHDEKLDAKFDHRDEQFLDKIEKLHKRLNKEGS